ncbi:hypothetical protein Q3G72_022710 [Acer saccharum]|nr:hypothetical protein Q3G72_022710 [Acer saccharum]
MQNAKCTPKFNIHDIDAGGFTALNIPPASPQCRRIDVKIEKTVQWTGAPRAKNINEKASQQHRSYLHKTCPMKVRNESQGNIYHDADFKKAMKAAPAEILFARLKIKAHLQTAY